MSPPPLVLLKRAWRLEPVGGVGNGADALAAAGDGATADRRTSELPAAGDENGRCGRVEEDVTTLEVVVVVVVTEVEGRTAEAEVLRAMGGEAEALWERRAEADGKPEGGEVSRGAENGGEAEGEKAGPD